MTLGEVDERISHAAIETYQTNRVLLINELRKEFAGPDIPLATTGMGGRAETPALLMNGQLTVPSAPASAQDRGDRSRDV